MNEKELEMNIRAQFKKWQRKLLEKPNQKYQQHGQNTKKKKITRWTTPPPLASSSSNLMAQSRIMVQQRLDMRFTTQMAK